VLPPGILQVSLRAHGFPPIRETDVDAVQPPGFPRRSGEREILDGLALPVLASEILHVPLEAQVGEAAKPSSSFSTARLSPLVPASPPSHMPLIGCTRFAMKTF
jgi:hypothetical protein